MMLIIAFSKKTSKFLPKIFCRKYKHCAPIIYTHKKYILLQFVNSNKIVKIELNKLGLKLLLNAGWDFITLKADRPNKMKKAKTCVNFTKKFIGMKAPFIQTPYSLYKKLKRP